MEGMNTVEIVKHLKVKKAHIIKQMLVRRDDHYYVLSSVNAPTGFETLAFAADEDGTIISCMEICGDTGMGSGDVLNALGQMTDEEIDRYWKEEV